TFLGTKVSASVGRIRALRVLVVGEVVYPGFKQVTSLSTALDALALAGGINKTGSLRRVTLVRQGKSIAIDLYDLLMRGYTEHDLTLAEGDRIVVLPIGATVAVGGWVKRPGIFELPANGNGLMLQQVLNLAGGHLRPYGLRYIQLRGDTSGKQTVVELVNLQDHDAKDGDILLVNLREDVQIGAVSIDGHVRIQERRSLLQAPTLRDLLRDGSTIKRDPYLLFAAVETTDENTRARRYYPVSIDRILKGAENFMLRDGDRLIILSADDVHFMRSPAVQAVLSGLKARKELSDYPDPSEPGPANQEGRPFSSSILDDSSVTNQLDEARRRQLDVAMLKRARLSALDTEFAEEEVAVCRSLDELQNIVEASAPGRFSIAVSASLTQEEVDKVGRPETCPEIFDRNPDLLVFALDYVVNLVGEVREPGAYPIIPGTNSTALLATVGGITRQADLTNIEITRVNVDRSLGVSNFERSSVNLSGNASSVLLNPGDVVRFNQVFSELQEGLVTIAGEFFRPGKYRIRRGETLSELIARAGNLTPQAYPYGAIFTRESAKVAERAALERSVRDLEASIFAASTARASSGQGNIDMSGVSELLLSIRSTEAVGRVVVEADPTVLQVRPDLDILLQPGDILIMPKRPSSVVVTGEVLSPGSQQFQSGSRPEDYLRFAGGVSPGSDA
ncbi:MAG: SLBB domain-containing protein, partial [Rhodospirillales bacterium]